MEFSIREIKKTNLQDTFFGTYFYRKVATYFTYLLARTSLTPNQISFLSLIITLLGAYYFYLGSKSDFIIGAILIQIGMILDYSDGQIARLKRLGTKRGGWLDVILGMIQNNILILAIILGIFKSTQDLTIWILGFVVLFAWNMTCYVHLNAMIFFPNLELKRTALAKQVSRGLKFEPQYLAIGSDVYFVLIGLGAIFNLLRESLLLLAIIGNSYWLLVAIFIFVNTKNVR